MSGHCTSEPAPFGGHPYTHIYCTGCSHAIVVPAYCKNRFCPVCSFARTRRIRARLNSLCRSIKTDHQWRLRFLTLSVSNDPDARSLTKHLIASFRKLRRRKWWRSRVRGGVSVLEITGSPGSWHVHIHAVIESVYLPWDDLHQLWKEISGGLGCWIQNISPSAAESYLSKYLTKESVHEDFSSELNSAMKDLRLFQPFGEWYDKLKLPKRIPYPCPQCGRTAWLPEVVVDMISRGYNHRPRSP